MAPETVQKTIEICDPEGSLGTTAVIGRLYAEADQLYDSYIEAFAMERKWNFYERSGVFSIFKLSPNCSCNDSGYLISNPSDC